MPHRIHTAGDRWEFVLTQTCDVCKGLFIIPCRVVLESTPGDRVVYRALEFIPDMTSYNEHLAEHSR